MDRQVIDKVIATLAIASNQFFYMENTALGTIGTPSSHRLQDYRAVDRIIYLSTMDLVVRVSKPTGVALFYDSQFMRTPEDLQIQLQQSQSILQGGSRNPGGWTFLPEASAQETLEGAYGIIALVNAVCCAVGLAPPTEIHEATWTSMFHALFSHESIMSTLDQKLFTFDSEPDSQPGDLIRCRNKHIARRLFHVRAYLTYHERADKSKHMAHILSLQLRPVLERWLAMFEGGEKYGRFSEAIRMLEEELGHLNAEYARISSFFSGPEYVPSSDPEILRNLVQLRQYKEKLLQGYQTDSVLLEGCHICLGALKLNEAISTLKRVSEQYSASARELMEKSSESESSGESDTSMK